MTLNKRVTLLEKKVNILEKITEQHSQRIKLIEDKVIVELIGIKESVKSNLSKWEKRSIFMGGFILCMIILMIASAIIY